MWNTAEPQRSAGTKRERYRLVNQKDTMQNKLKVTSFKKKKLTLPTESNPGPSEGTGSEYSGGSWSHRSLMEMFTALMEMFIALLLPGRGTGGCSVSPFSFAHTA